MKKIILLVLCFIFVLSGCEKLVEAKPYYTETREDVVLDTQFEYYFDDEGTLRCIWKNESSETFSFYDTFELHVLNDDGKWYKVSNGEIITFNTNYTHGIEPKSESNARYDIGLYTDELKDGKTYRISTFFFDENGNNYQIYAEFICNNALAEEEMKEASNGMLSHRDDPVYGGGFNIG